MPVVAQLDPRSRTKLEKLLKSLEPAQQELSLPQLLALGRIAVEPGLSVNELAERLNCPQQTASRHVAALLGRYQTLPLDSEPQTRSALEALIVQEISQVDPRRRALFISQHGQALLQNMLSG